MKRTIEQFEADFWNKLKKQDSGCWEWTGARNGAGYGLLSRYISGRGKSIVRETHATNRWAWIFTNGEIPNGMLVCHKCDNPPCCNPEHLFLGTHRDNSLDSTKKGRHHKLCGEQINRGGLTEFQVRIILRLKGQMYLREVSEIFSTPISNVSRLWRGTAWKHIRREDAAATR